MTQKAKPRILIIGDSFIDEYLYCSYVKQNPEADGSVYKIDKRQYYLGGASAVARICSSLGCQVELATAIGNDNWQGVFRRLLDEHRISWYPEIGFPQPYKTIVKTRMVVEDQLYPDRFDNEKVVPVENTLLFDMIIKRIQKSDITLIADYGKGMVGKYLLDKLPRDRTILVDPAIGRSWGDYHGCCTIKANEKEAIAALRETNTVSHITDYARTLADIYDRSVVVTRGKIGLQYANHNQTATTRDHSNGFIPAIETQAKDICGAGDTVFAVIGTFLAKGFNLKEACEYAVRYASQQIQSFGIRSLTPLEKEVELCSQHVE